MGKARMEKAASEWRVIGLTAAIMGTLAGFSICGDVNRRDNEAKSAIEHYDNAVRQKNQYMIDESYKRMRNVLSTTTENPRDEISNISPKWREELKKRVQTYQQKR